MDEVFGDIEEESHRTPCGGAALDFGFEFFGEEVVGFLCVVVVVVIDEDLG